jgi:hypothetical protein
MQRWIAMVAAVAFGACGGVPEPEESAPATLRLVSVDTIPDPDGRLIGRFSTLFVARDSTMYLPIHYVNHVLQLDRDGTLIRRIGRHGSGPGEFSTSPHDVVEWGDSLAFVNLANRQVALFHRADGRFLHRYTVDGFPWTLAATAERLVVGALSISNGTAAAVLARGDTAMRPIIPMPAAWQATPIALRRWPITLVTAAREHVVVGIPSSPWLFVATHAGTVVDSIAVPSVRRRAVPSDIDRRLEPLLQSRLASFLYATLVALETRADGLQLAVHHDWFTSDTTDRPMIDGERITDTLRAFASFIDRTNRQACVDTPVPTDWAALPTAISAHGNDLLVLGHVDDGSEIPVVELRRYRVDLSSCGWMPLDSPPA